MWGQSEDSYNQFLINISDTIRPLEKNSKKKKVFALTLFHCLVNIACPS